MPRPLAHSLFRPRIWKRLHGTRLAPIELVKLELLLLAVCVACSGKVERPSPEPAANVGGGGVTASGGVAGTSPIPDPKCGKIAPFYCVPEWCGGDVVTSPECSNGVWTCTNQWIPQSDCPDDACFHGPVEWCCDADGTASAPTCPNQAAPVCPSDTYLMWGGPFCPAAGTFPCGDELTCQLGTEYCKHDANGAASCVALPDACNGTPACGCLLGATCWSCEDAGIGAVALYCD